MGIQAVSLPCSVTMLIIRSLHDMQNSKIMVRICSMQLVSTSDLVHTHHRVRSLEALVLMHVHSMFHLTMVVEVEAEVDEVVEAEAVDEVVDDH